MVISNNDKKQLLNINVACKWDIIKKTLFEIINKTIVYGIFLCSLSCVCVMYGCVCVKEREKEKEEKK